MEIEICKNCKNFEIENSGKITRVFCKNNLAYGNKIYKREKSLEEILKDFIKTLELRESVLYCEYKIEHKIYELNNER